MSSNVFSMKSNNAGRHIHQLERSKKDPEVYRCIHPRCKYYQYKAYLLGKEALCRLCGAEFILDADQLRNAKPRCEMCQDTKKARALKEALEKIDILVNDNTEDFQPLFENLEIPKESEN